MTQANATAQTARGCCRMDGAGAAAGQLSVGCRCSRGSFFFVGAVRCRAGRGGPGSRRRPWRGPPRRAAGRSGAGRRRRRHAPGGPAPARCGRPRSARPGSSGRRRGWAAWWPSPARRARHAGAHRRLRAAVRGGERADGDRPELVDLGEQPEARGGHRGGQPGRVPGHGPDQAAGVEHELGAQLLQRRTRRRLIGSRNQYCIGVLCMSRWAGESRVTSGRPIREGSCSEHLAGVEDVERVERRLDAALQSTASGSSSRRIPPRLSRPTPCSPVTVPPSAIAASSISSNAACARPAAASSPAGVSSSGCRLPSPACAMVAIRDVVPRGDLLDLRRASPAPSTGARRRPR